MNGLSVTVVKNGLFRGSRYALIRGIAVFIKIRIRIRILILERLKTCFSVMSLEATKLLELFGSGVGKANNNSAL